MINVHNKNVPMPNDEDRDNDKQRINCKGTLACNDKNASSSD